MGRAKGRPYLDDELYRGESIHVKVNRTEKIQFEKLAAKRNQTISDMVRDLVTETLQKETGK